MPSKMVTKPSPLPKRTDYHNHTTAENTVDRDLKGKIKREGWKEKKPKGKQGTKGHGENNEEKVG